MNFWKQKKLVVLVILIAIGAFLVVPHAASAAGLVPCGGPSDNHPCGVLDAFYMVARVTNWLIAVAGLYAVYQIVSGAFWLAISMGNEEDISKRRKWVTNAIVGFVVVMMAYVFMNTAVNMILLS
ncbi:MAG: hypothetical protein KGJ93_05095, partial [Patescibacteria group bacterium]|nr:hypothetical protein [Patescibacteria group bacterium]